MNTENNKMDNGLDLLNKVIKSNEDNIEKLASTVSIYQDILNDLLKIHSLLLLIFYILNLQ